jgi:diguanylate cyclase (GGDEF)-like protein/PAS domain S-box-containing protein
MSADQKLMSDNIITKDNMEVSENILFSSNYSTYDSKVTKLEEQLAGLAASMPGFIYTLKDDADNNINLSYASNGIIELFDLTPSEAIRDTSLFWSRFHQNDLERILALFHKSKTSLTPFKDETRIFYPNENTLWIEIRSMPQLNEDGSTEWHGLIMDITERVQAKEAILHTQSALEQAQHIAHIGSWDVDIVNDKLTWSDETFRIWEIDKTKFAATFSAFIETVHPEDREKVINSYNNSIADKTSYQIEHRLLFSDGRVKYIQERGEPYFDESGRPIRFIGTSLDVTERKRFEGLVSLQNHALDHIGEAVYLVDEQARICHVNKAACTMLGYSQEELLAIKIYELDPNYYPENWQNHWKELMQKGTITLETLHKSKLGALIPIEVNANAIQHEGQIFNFALVRNITERKLFEEKLYHQASYDFLTGLPNRPLLLDRLNEEIIKAKRSQSDVSLLFIDLDHFKEINDSLGHDQGDLLLIQAAQRIQLCIQESDVLGRMGGDEFVVILSGLTEPSYLGRIAQNIIDAMTMPFSLDNNISYVSASIGIANYPSDVDNMASLISAADQAMYVAKERGRNGFSFFTPNMHKEVQERLELANDLREAILKKQLQIYLQPIVEISTEQIVKAEALIRWNHPRHGMVPPDKFIPIAEETGLIHEVGDLVFHKATEVMSRWLEIDPHGYCQISVNMSARQFLPSDVGTAWIGHLSIINLHANHLVIEITESLLLGEEINILEKLNRFREAGIEVALDDFGTGYSAMSYLKKFNIDYLKIDRSFVRDLETDQNDRAIAEAIVVMAHKLGLKTIAEGVETEQQKNILAEVGCDYVQGYYFAKPMPVEDFLSLVKIKLH